MQKTISLSFAAVIAAGAGCNVISGADDIVVVDDDGSISSGDGSGGFFGVGGAGPTGGPSGTQTSSGSGFGGDPSTGGAGQGPASSGNGSSSSNGSSGATSGSASSSAATSSSSSGGGEMCDGAGPTTTALDAEEQAFLTEINDYRAMNSLGPLAHCVSLDRAAQGHSEDMRDQNYFSHTGLDGSSPWARSCDACFDQGCGPSTAMAENIAAGNSSGAATFTQWQNSPGHNANMLGANFTMIGIGRATGGGQYGVYWTTVFAGSDEPSCY